MENFRNFAGSLLRLRPRVFRIGRGIMFRKKLVAETGNISVIELQYRNCEDRALARQDDQRRAHGHRLFGINVDDRVVSYGWAALAGCEVALFFDVSFNVPPNSIYIWDCYTEPEYRNRGHFKMLLTQIPEKVRNAQTALVAVDVSNAPSKAAIRGAEFTESFKYLGAQIAGKTFLRLAFCSGKVQKLTRTLDSLSQLD